MTPPRTAGPVDTEKSPAATWKTLDARAVTIDGGVWARAQAVNRDAAIPHGYRMLEKAGKRSAPAAIYGSSARGSETTPSSWICRCRRG